MNRVVFLFLSILLIGFPLTINNFDNENVNYLELVKNITNELIHTVVKAQIKNPSEINFTNDQVALLKIKLDELKKTDLEFENNLMDNYKSSIIQVNKEILTQVTQDLEIQKEMVNDIKQRLARAEATWDMAENIFQQLADQVRQHEYDIKDLNR